MPSAINQKAPTVLLIAASRGLGLAMAEEFLKKGWSVVGTVRGESPGRNCMIWRMSIPNVSK